MKTQHKYFVSEFLTSEVRPPVIGRFKVMCQLSQRSLIQIVFYVTKRFLWTPPTLPSDDIRWNEVIKPSNWKNLNIFWWIMKEPGTFFLFKNWIDFPTKKTSYNCSNGIKLFNCTPCVILFLRHRNSYGRHNFVPLILKPYTTINFKQQINQFENIIK